MAVDGGVRIRAIEANPGTAGERRSAEDEEPIAPGPEPLNRRKTESA
jgi:hypothetical protein